jgi:hypothetical protein
LRTSDRTAPARFRRAEDVIEFGIGGKPTLAGYALPWKSSLGSVEIDSQRVIIGFTRWTFHERTIASITKCENSAVFAQAEHIVHLENPEASSEDNHADANVRLQFCCLR